MEELTLLILLGCIVLVLGPAGFFLARGARRDLRVMRITLQEMNARIVALEQGGAAAPRTGPWSAPAARPEPDAEPAPETPADAPEPPPEAQDLPGAPPREEPGWLGQAAASVPTSPPRRRRAGFEETLGTRWTVWVGGAALALGAILLVRYSIEQGFFGPGVRVFFGALLALALVAAGEWLRRREPTQAVAGDSALPYIPGVLTAAGTIAAFATLWAAHALYGFIGPGVALVLMGATGLATMAAAALHGPAMAGLGLVGAFATPMLVRSDAPSAWPVVLYVGVIAACAYGLARLRLWLWLALASALGAALWGVLIAESAPGSVIVGSLVASAIVHLVVQTALALVFVAVLPNRGVADEAASLDPPAHAAAAIFVGLAVFTLAQSLVAGQFSALWDIGALMTAGLLIAAGAGVAPAAGAVVAGAFVALFALWIWPVEVAGPVVRSGQEVFTDSLLPVEPTRFWIFAVVSAVGAAGVCGWRLFKGPALRLPIAAIFAGVAGVVPLAVLGIVFLRVTQGASSPLLGALACVLALVFVSGARLFQISRRLGESIAYRLALGALASGAIGALALGCVFVLEGGTLTVAIAIAALGAAYVAVRLDIPALRWCVVGFGLVVAARYAWDPRIAGAALGTTPVFNWLLFGYGVPAAAFAAASRIMSPRGEDLPVRVADGCAVLFSALLVFFEIRHGMNGGDPFARDSGLIEQGLMAMSSFAFSAILVTLDARRANPVFRVASSLAAALGIGSSLAGLAVFANPFLSGDAIPGGAVFNGLILGYVLPCLAAFVLARRARAHGRRLLARAAGVTTIFLLFLYATLEVRRLFHTERIGWLKATGDAESYCYSAAWLVLGVALLAYGLWRQSSEARVASAIFIVLTVLKVFLLDLQGLDGIFRALSFIGLGAVLIAIGLVYQKIVFVRPTPPPDAAAEGSR